MTYTLPSIKTGHSDKDGRPTPEYMDINTDDAEAGSILMSLSQHSKKPTTTSKTIASTMSIRNLLGDDDQRLETTSRKQVQPNGNTLATWPHKEGIMHRYPETSAPPPSYSFEERRQHGMHHAQPTTLLPAAPTHMRSTDTSAHGPSEKYIWQQRPLHTYHSHQPTRPSHHPSSYSQQQSYQSMNPKIRRNALHAYISYLIYSDLVRAKSNRTYNNRQQPTEKKPDFISNQNLQKPPLTAFLKKYNVDPPPPLIHQSPTTPRPKQAFPPHHPPYHSTASRPTSYPQSPPLHFAPSQQHRERRR